MKKYTIIGNMTGNSMDASDLVLTEFEEDQIKDICTYSKPYSKKMQKAAENLRRKVLNKTKDEILALDDFKLFHDEYIHHTASTVLEMCDQHKISKQSIDAIGFHGKTLDHYPPSIASQQGGHPYTLQIGSGKMLADLTGLNVIYDFRSDFIFQNLEGAPLIGPHNAHIARIEGNGIYYNGGNTSNFAIIQNENVLLSTDAGPCNEYIDFCVRSFCDMPYDKDGIIGKKGTLNTSFLGKLFDFGRTFYQTPLPKSGDPAFYRKNDIFRSDAFNSIKIEDAVHTFEYFAAYVAAHALTLVPQNIALPENIIFFGGGWKNPLIRQSFENLISGKAFVLSAHRSDFEKLQRRFLKPPSFKYSAFGTYMEARLMADLAYFKLQNKPWMNNIICGKTATPQTNRTLYDDCINRAAKGW